jgi:putative DNA primase/helicase
MGIDVVLPKGFENAKQDTYNRETDAPLQMYGFTDLENARRFQWRYEGKFVYTKATGWLVYDRGRWRIDKTYMAEQAMQSTLNLITQEADLVEGTGKEADDLRKAFHNWATSCEGMSLFNNAMKRSQTLAAFARDYNIFDRQPDLFLCGNGTLNLKTGEFGPFDPKHLLTKGSNVMYDPAATCPKWEKFIADVQQGKEHMIRYLARAIGYTLTTDTGGQCLFVPYGTGGTGKSTLLNVLRGILGDYSFDADAEMFMSKKGDSGQPFEYAGMEGKRGLFAVETENGKELACVKVKRMTGQDPIRASYKGKDHYTIIPCFKVWLATNDRPKMNATDDAMWDRPKLIPFDVKFRDQPTEIKNIAEMLLAEEAPGILNWMLAGHAEWVAQGLNNPEEVKYAVAEWREEEDDLGSWLKENTVKTDVQNEFVPKKDLHERYCASGKEANGISQRDFNEAMRRKGFLADDKWVMGKTRKVWVGLKYTGTMGNYSSNMSDFAHL